MRLGKCRSRSSSNSRKKRSRRGGVGGEGRKRKRMRRTRSSSWRSRSKRSRKRRRRSNILIPFSDESYAGVVRVDVSSQLVDPNLQTVFSVLICLNAQSTLHNIVAFLHAAAHEPVAGACFNVDTLRSDVIVCYSKTEIYPV